MFHRILFFLLSILILSPISVKASDLVAKVSFKGNEVIESDAIRTLVKIKEGEPLDPDKIRDGIRDIFGMGYFSDVQVDLSSVEDGKELTFIVSEKPQVREIEFKGNKELETDKLKDLLTFKAYTILDQNKIRESISKIKAEYEGTGYYVADVQFRTEDMGENRVKLIFEISENEKVLVKKITLLGNSAYSDDELKKILQTKEGTWSSWISSKGTFKEEIMQLDHELLTTHYLNTGYFQAKIEEARVTITPDKRWIYISYRIEEGKKFWIGKISFKGDIVGSTDELLKSIKIKEGDVFNRDQLRRDIVSLTDFYGDKGYAFANVVPLTSANQEKQLVDLTFDIRKGDLIYFERINIAGNIKTRDKVIRREMKVAEGELYHGSNLKKSRQKINSLGFFEEVNLTTERGSDPTKLNVKIDVKERSTGTLTFGAGYSSVDSFMVMGQVSQGNLFGRGQKLQFSAEIGSKRKTYNLGFTEPRLFDTEISAGFDVFQLEKEYDDFSKRSNGGDIRLGFPLKYEDTRGYLTYRYETINIYNVSDSASLYISEQEGNKTTASLTMSIVRDTRNDYIAPTSGSKSSASIEYAGPVLGGEQSFIKYSLDSSVYFPVIWETALMFHGTLAYGEGLQGDKLPVEERYYVGGMNSVRGFEPRSVGPRYYYTQNNIPVYDEIGGDTELIFNIEYLFPLIKEANLRGVIFFDAGNAYDTEGLLNVKSDDFGTLRTSAGYGVRWYSPIGPLRLEWGYNLNPKEDEASSKWEFSIGTFF